MKGYFVLAFAQLAKKLVNRAHVRPSIQVSSENRGIVKVGGAEFEAKARLALSTRKEIKPKDVEEITTVVSKRMGKYS